MPISNFLTPRLDNYGTASIVYRLFLLLLVVLVLFIKDHSYTGWYFITTEFYLMVAAPFLGFIAFTIYMNLGTSPSTFKTVLRIFCILVLSGSLYLQGLLIYTAIDQVETPLNFLISLIPGMFLFSTVYTLVGIFKKQL
jgi:hypothetical protein